MSKRIVTKDIFTREWIIQQSIDIVSRYEPGDLTIRALHYQLVSRGMTNTMQHYKRVVKAMEVARWDGSIDFEAFSDLERTMACDTEVEETILNDKIAEGRVQVEAWMKAYSKNRWENQPYYVEVFIEKKALQNVFYPVCSRNRVGLAPVKGYPSLTFLHQAKERFEEAIERDKTPVILYFGDYDPSGEDIPRSIEDNLSRMGVDVDVRRQALFEHQVIEWKLPPAPAKETDSRTANWNGLGQVELDAVDPDKLKQMCQDAIDDVFDDDLHDQLLDQERKERPLYQEALKAFVNTLKTDEDDDESDD